MADFKRSTSSSSPLTSEGAEVMFGLDLPRELSLIKASFAYCSKMSFKVFLAGGSCIFNLD